MIRYALFLLLSSVFATSVNAQKATADSAAKESPVFEKLEVEASVDLVAWRKHLETQLLAYIENAARRGMKPGIYTVNVRFLVGLDGRISDVQALNDPGFGLAIGAVRTVRTGPRWTPGQVDGRKVRSYHTQPISFSITEK